MTSLGSSLARFVLVAVWLTAAVLKFVHFVIEKDWTVAAPWMQSNWFVTTVVVAELGTAALLLTSRADWGCWASLGLIAAGNAILALARWFSNEGLSCGCLGKVPLSLGQHATLSVGVFLLAIVCLRRCWSAERSAR